MLSEAVWAWGQGAPRGPLLLIDAGAVFFSYLNTGYSGSVELVPIDRVGLSNEAYQTLVYFVVAREKTPICGRGTFRESQGQLLWSWCGRVISYSLWTERANRLQDRGEEIGLGWGFGPVGPGSQGVCCLEVGLRMTSWPRIQLWPLGSPEHRKEGAACRPREVLYPLQLLRLSFLLPTGP